MPDVRTQLQRAWATGESQYAGRRDEGAVGLTACNIERGDEQVEFHDGGGSVR